VRFSTGLSICNVIRVYKYEKEEVTGGITRSAAEEKEDAAGAGVEEEVP